MRSHFIRISIHYTHIPTRTQRETTLSPALPRSVCVSIRFEIVSHYAIWTLHCCVRLLVEEKNLCALHYTINQWIIYWSHCRRRSVLFSIAVHIVIVITIAKKGQYLTQRRLMYITATNRTPKCDYNKSISEMESVYRCCACRCHYAGERRRSDNTSTTTKKRKETKIIYGNQLSTKWHATYKTHNSTHACTKGYLIDVHTIHTHSGKNEGKAEMVWRMGRGLVWKTKRATKLLMYD